MKAMVVSAEKEVALGEVAGAATGEGQVLVRVTYSGICGTDYKIYSGAIPVRYPRIMGHEMIGEVVEAGPGAAVRPGDRAIVDPEVYGGACFHCRIGQTHFGPNGMRRGRGANGGFAEYVTAPASHVFPLPESIDNQTAPLIQVLTTCLHAQRQIDIFPGETVAVLGLGVTGQLHVQLAKARGATVIGITRSAEKRGLALRLGADLAFPGGEEAIRKVREATEGRGADAELECTALLPMLSAGINKTRSAGRLPPLRLITAKH